MLLNYRAWPGYLSLAAVLFPFPLLLRLRDPFTEKPSCLARTLHLASSPSAMAPKKASGSGREPSAREKEQNDWRSEEHTLNSSHSGESRMPSSA